MGDWPDPAWVNHPLKPEADAALALDVINALQPWNQSPVAVSSVVAILDHLHESVVQVLHPWPTDDGLAAWSDVAARIGVVRSDLWPVDAPDEYAQAALQVTGGPAPREGRLEPHVAMALVDYLASATTTPDDVLYLIWNGWSGVPYDRWHGAAEVDLPHRPSILLRGPVNGLTADLSDSEDPSNAHLGALLCWPADRTWVMASEVDLPFTCVVGSEQLVQAILDDTSLESVRTTPEAPVTAITS